MRYLLVTLEYPPFKGGVAHYYGHLIEHWPDQSSIAVLDNHDHQLLASGGWWPWRRAFQSIRRAIKQQSIDFLLVGQILPLGTVVWLLSLVKSFQYGVFLHGMDWFLARSSWRKTWLSNRILQRASVIVVANSYIAEQVRQALPQLADRLVVVNPGLASLTPPVISQSLITELTKEYQLANRLVLLTVGRVVERKGIDMVIRSLPSLIQKYRQLIYVVVGQGPYLANCQQLAKELEVTESVVFITTANDQQRSAWYQLADIFIMPSRQIGEDMEGFGIVYLEANQAGKPVIAGRSGGVADAVVDGLNGLMVDPESINQIEQAVSRLIDDQDLAQQLGQAGQQRLVDFLWSGQANKIYQFINK